LVRRCVGVINSHLWRLGGELARDGFNDVVEQLFERILDLNTDRGDFLQVRFWVVLDRLAGSAFNKQLSQYQEARKREPLTALPGYDRDDEDGARTARPVDDAAVMSPAADEALDEDELLRERRDRIRDALGRLGEPLRTVFLLRHHAGWPIEDQDPTVRTISRHFGKTPRTIRNWLNQAEEILEKWRGEQR
jgi:RNA polymerase sigma factor (sigma-70 family)